MRTLPRVCAAVLLAAPAGAWALGLGDIQLQSALNQPFRAEIALLSASADELQSVKVGLASPETFSRYGLDQPADLSSLRFKIAKNAAGQNIILVTSDQRIDDPFVTMLVEATWARGRLLREYTVLLDPPVLLPGPAEQAPIRQVQTSRPQPAPAAEGAIARPAAAETQSAPPASTAAASAPPAAQPGSASPDGSTAKSTEEQAAAPASAAGSPSSAASAASYGPVQQDETLWGIASNLKPSDVTTNQMMVALYEANPGAFEHNMNVLLRGATLSVPGGGELTALSAAAATAEVKRQAASWQSRAPAEKALAKSSPPQEQAAPPAEQARLRLLPPKADGPASAGGTGSAAGASAAGAGANGQAGGSAGGAGSASQAEVANLREQVASLQGQLEQNQRLLQLRDQQLQALQDQVAQRQTGGAPAPAKPAASGTAAPGVALESEQLFTDDAGKKAAAAAASSAALPASSAAAPKTDAASSAAPGAAKAEQASASEAQTQSPAAASAQANQNASPQAAAPGKAAKATKTVKASPAVPAIPAPSLLSRVLGWIANPVLLIGLGIGAVLLTAVWYLRFRREDVEDVTGRWDALEAEIEEETRSASARFKRPAHDGVLVEEQGRFSHPDSDDEAAFGESSEAEPGDETTLSTQTVINLDQADPVAEADFHMAYGLYDQAAELVSKALEAEPLRRDLKLKLLEVYFVWGNKDAFLQAARELRADIGGAASGDWDKVLIMGKQICPGEPLFAESAAADFVDVDLQSDGSTELDFAFDETNAGEEVDFDTHMGTGTDDDLGFELAATGELLARSDADAEDEDEGEAELADFESELDIGAQTAAGLEAALFMDDDGKDAPSATRPSAEFDSLAVTQESPTAEHRRDDEEDWASLLDDVAASDEDEDEDLGSQAPTVETPTLDGSMPGLDLEEAEAFGPDSPTIETPTVETPRGGRGNGLALETSEHDVPTVETAYAGAQASRAEAPLLEEADESGFAETDTGLDPTASDTLTADDEEAADSAVTFDFADSAGSSAAEHTEEIDLDDLGLSLGDLEDLPDDIGGLPSAEDGEEDTREQRALAADDALLAATGVTEVLQEDDLDHEIELRAEAAESGLSQLDLPETDFDSAELNLGETSVLADHEATHTPTFEEGTFVGTEVLEQRRETDDSGDTSLLKSLAGLNVGAAGADGSLDLNLEDLSAALQEGDTVEQPRSSSFEDFFGGNGHTPIDLDVGMDLPGEDDPTGNESFGPLDPQTMTEIGTKIDLARAYIDMGDPEGARSILEEVLDEGDSTQRREAQGLIDAMSA
ncbi:MAG TPA: FimV/HubP family polar landmark protein [Gammaproteobacteria bacterium]|nr:FimV/HubP family polar landmark protein [Gammaproteobacteria bacterium]